MSAQFAKLYSEVGRPSIAPERLFRSLLLQIFYSVRSERMLIEQLEYNLLFRWFVGMEMDERMWNHAVYSKNRERHIAQNNTNRRSAVDERTTRHAGYERESAEAKTSGSSVRVDEDGRDAKESEVARDRQGRVAGYLYRSCL